MTTRAERIDKLTRMAQQTVSPNEAAVAKAKLEAMGEWPPKPPKARPQPVPASPSAATFYARARQARENATNTRPVYEQPIKRSHQDAGPFSPDGAAAAFMDSFMAEFAKAAGGQAAHYKSTVRPASDMFEEDTTTEHEAFQREWQRARAAANKAHEGRPPGDDLT